jgi:NADH-quinone oxidoreductase subunit L
MFNMGGLGRKMPVTFWTFLIGGLALSGFPVITAGFWSKDAILSGAFGGGYILLFITLALAALLTAFYTMRQITLTFLGNPRTRSAGSASETSWVMTLPLVMLAVFAVAAGWAGIPTEFPGLGGIIPNWFGIFIGSMTGEPLAVEGASLMPLFTSLLVSIGGLALGWLAYRKIRTGEPDPLQSKLGGIYTLLRKKYYIDEIYSAILIRPSIWIAEVFTARWVDGRVIDGIINGLGKVAQSLGKVFSRGFDLPVITGFGNKVSEGVRALGLRLRSIQSGHIQQYMIFAIVIALVIGVISYFLLV